jgi:hypothetical protein
LADNESQQKGLGIVPGDGEPPGDFRLQRVRENWEREWATLSELTRQANQNTYATHRDYQMQIDDRWTCGCPACLTIRKHLLLEYWRAENLERQASEQYQHTFREYEASQAGTDAKQELLNRFAIELNHFGELSKKTTELLWQACGQRRPTSSS